MIEIRPVTRPGAKDAEALFATGKGSESCFCMWHIIRVADYHANGREGNRKLFRDLVKASEAPVGLLAYRDGEPVGWCAAGPRSRYARAIATPAFKGRDPSEDDDVWLVPCFYVREDVRKQGVSGALLEAAVRLASDHGATAIEGFPLAAGARPSRDSLVGMEPVFASCGFNVTRRTGPKRVVMRRDLTA